MGGPLALARSLLDLALGLDRKVFPYRIPWVDSLLCLDHLEPQTNSLTHQSTAASLVALTYLALDPLTVLARKH